MVTNGADAKPSAEQIDEWVATFPAYDTKKMKRMVQSHRTKLKAEGVATTPGPTDKDGLRAEQADLERKMAAYRAQFLPLVKAEPQGAAAGPPTDATTPGPTDKDGLRAEQADLERKMAAFLAQHWPLVKAEPQGAAAGLPTDAATKHAPCSALLDAHYDRLDGHDLKPVRETSVDSLSNSMSNSECASDATGKRKRGAEQTKLAHDANRAVHLW